MPSLLATELEADNIALSRADGGALLVIPIPQGALGTLAPVRTLTTGTTAANPLGETIFFDTSGGAIDYQLPAAPIAGGFSARFSFMWKAGTTPPTIDGNGKQVASWSQLNQSSAGTQVINVLGGNGTIAYDGTQWWWVT